MTIQFGEMHCRKCSKTSVVEVLVDVEISLFLHALKKTRCGHCGAGYRSLDLGKTPVERPDAAEVVEC
jgi:hypothetical protein